jgi:chemotaxis protein CheC
MKDGTCDVKDQTQNSTEYYDLNGKEKDALQEAGNIAAAYAATALSKMIGEEIMLSVTQCKLINVDKIPRVLGKKTDMVVAVNMVIPTRNLCSILMLFPYEAAKVLCDLFFKKKRGSTKKINEKEITALTEIGNICICAYLNALSKLLNVELLPTPPSVASDMVGSILQEVAISADAVNESAILIETKFLHKKGENKGHFLFILDRKSKEAIFKVFKVKSITK